MKAPQKKEAHLPVAEFRKKLAEQIKRSQAGRNIIVTSHGKPSVVLISYAEYLSLVNDQPVKPAVIHFDEWEKEAGQRKKVAESVASMFDNKKLNRKGQKGYKNSALREFNTTQKTTGKSGRRNKP